MKSLLWWPALLGAFAIAAIAPAAETRPNILLIISDQHSADVMSGAGYPYVKTPALDGIAARGVRFPNTYCAYPVCMSSRASLMTGRLPHQLKVADEETDSVAGAPKAKGKKSGKRTDAQAHHSGTSLGMLMKAAGYRTGYFGKWHVGGVSSSPQNLWHGFDTLVDGRRDEATATKAIEFIGAKATGPFFAVVSLLNPHDICEWARMRSGLNDKMGNGDVSLHPPLADCPPLPANFAIPADEPEIVGLRRNSQPERAHPTQKWGETEWRQYRWAYARFIEKMDEQVGRVVEALKKNGQLEQTLIVYTSDHGDGNGAHHWNQKMVLYEEAVRIPLIVSWPGHTAAGRVDQARLVSMGLDLLPTFCDFAGAKVPAELTGRSVRPFTAPTPAATVDDKKNFVVVSEVDYKSLLPGTPLAHGHLVRTPGFTYIIYSAGKNPEQLFDIRADPGQMNNLARHADYQSVLMTHRELLRGWVRQNKSPFPLDRIP
ncbi:MAG: sulfatase-like hydrolase/transferase [Opitutaceae bacterium]|nr:sulfatase-like hydrolase/transferase [Opitutaceae bacterium]